MNEIQLTRMLDQALKDDCYHPDLPESNGNSTAAHNRMYAIITS